MGPPSGTASWSASAVLHILKPLALLGKPRQQRRHLRVGAHALAVLLELVDHGLETHGVGVEHRTAPVDRPAVTVDPDDVDVRGPDRDAFLKDLGALVDHREDAALEDLLLGDLARLLAGLGHEVADDLLGDGRRTRLAVLVVVVVAGAGLL